MVSACCSCSPESTHPGEIGRESDKQQLLGRFTRQDSPVWARAGGWRTALFSWSLGLTMDGLFLLSRLAQSVAGHSAYNAEQLGQLQDPVSWAGYATSANFWNRTLQNWQSEFLAIGSMAVFSVYMRYCGSLSRNRASRRTQPPTSPADLDTYVSALPPVTPSTSPVT